VKSETEAEPKDRSHIVSAGILLSRISGLVRERVLGHFFGASVYADAWRAAMRLPNLLQNLLGEGTLSSSFIPVLSEMRVQGREEEARAFAGAIFGLLLAVVGMAVLFGVLLAGPLVQLLFPGFDSEQQARTAGLVRILFPMTGVLVLSAWTLGVLNAHRRFFLPYVAPVLWNLAIIAALVWGGWTRGLSGEALLRLGGIGALLGGALQFGVQLPRALQLLGGFRPVLSLQVSGVQRAIQRFTPSLAGRGAVNLGSYLEYVLASFLAAGAIATLGYAQTLYLLPIALFGMSVAISQLPELAEAEAAQVRRATIVRRLEEALFRVSYFVVPSVMVYLGLGTAVVAALYQTGAFGAPEVQLTSWVLGAYALGIWPSAQSRLLSSGFFALGNTKTPAWVALIRVVVALSVGGVLMVRLDRFTLEGGLAMGAIGLALGSAAGGWAEFLVLRKRLQSALSRPLRWGGLPFLKLLLSGALAVIFGAGADWALGAGHLPAFPPVIHGGAVLVIVGVIYLVVTSRLGLSSFDGRGLRLSTPHSRDRAHD
jgi:putative peptidoglycan lipid II flippase